MDISIDRDELYRAIARAQSIIERKSNMPILSNILLSARNGTLSISATDLELGFQNEIPVQINSEGNITISGRKLFEILKEGKNNNIKIQEKENNWVFITDGFTRFNLATYPADEYPVFFEPDEIELVDISGALLSEMIEKTVYAVSTDEAGYKLSGIFIQRVSRQDRVFLRMVATDGHRLSLIDKPFSAAENLGLGNGLMVPKKGMLELGKMGQDGGSILLGFKDKNCVARKEKALLVIRLLESKFPDYDAVIPKDAASSVEVARGDLLDAMKRMEILSNERYRAVKIAFENNRMELVSTNPDLGDAQEALDVVFQGERVEAGFNPRYFIDILQSMESERVSLGFSDESKPCTLKGEADKGFLGLIMPMRL
ncbi:DNA polymerase III subunit beta [uncultured Desulfatiglans sp.]|uniref:Beta sliding clamp n=1 Tax=Uncultured Desulfatiglans sp. TaxID=1748965 RepID=A0A653AJE7_UNCDX|nr:DNA polymerase III subunit beta [uncultured Desulfatiglans sp.]